MAFGFDAGSAFINVLPRATGFAASLRTQTAPALNQLESSFASTTKRLGTSISGIGSTLTRNLSLPLAAAGAAATKIALDYETAFTRISAISNASASDVEKWRTQVEQLAIHAGRDPQELADALFFLASAGLKVNQVMPALRVSAEAAAIGLGETSDVARLTAQVLNAYAGSALKAADVTDTLQAAVKASTAAPNEFADAMGRILPIASKAGISFEQIAASLAGLSNIGLDVNEGVTAMRGLFQALVTPTAAASDALHKIGVSAQELLNAIHDQGLLGAMELLDTAARRNTDTEAKYLGVLRTVIPNVRALTGELGLTGKNAETVAGIFDQVTHSSGALSDAFKTTKEGPMFQFQQGMAQLKVAAIQLGNELLPIAQKVVGFISDMAKAFSDLSPSMQESIVKWGLLAIALGPVLRLLGGIIRLGGGVVGVLTRIGGAVAGVGAASTVAATETTGVTAALGGLTGGEVAVGLAITAGGILAIAHGAALAGQRVSAMFDDLTGGQVTVATLNDKVGVLAGNLDTLASQRVGRGAPAGGGAVEGADEARAAIARYEAELAKIAHQFGLTDIEAFRFAETMNTATDTTLAQGKRIGAVIGAYHIWDRAISANTVQMVKNLLAQGDFADAMRLLRRDFNAATKEVRQNLAATNANKDAAADADRAQHLLAGSTRDAGDAASDSARDVKEYHGELSAVPANVKTRLSLIGLEAARGGLLSVMTLANALDERSVDLFVRTHRSTDFSGPKWGATGFHGTVTKPTLFGAGEAGTERVDITPAGQMAPGGSGRIHGQLAVTDWHRGIVSLTAEQDQLDRTSGR